MTLELIVPVIRRAVHRDHARATAPNFCSDTRVFEFLGGVPKQGHPRADLAGGAVDCCASEGGDRSLVRRGENYFADSAG
jgi:hypothetical protein